MGIGPFDSFSFPDVYTETLNAPPTPTAAGSLRFPAFIGVAEDTIPFTNVEMIRGSSSLADNKITREDVSNQFTGANREFKVSFFPIVDGSGAGIVTNDPTKVVVTVNSSPVPVSSVNGNTGVINLISLPAVGDEVEVTYYFKLIDDLHTKEDLSDQVDGTLAQFETHFYPIVSGNNAGSVTTDVTKVAVYVNNNPVTVSAVDGANGKITLAVAPVLGATLTVTYYSNELQHTADILPSPFVAGVNKVGLSPGTTDFLQGPDYVLDSTIGAGTGDTFYTLQWGASYKIVSGNHTIATNFFNGTQISATLLDERVYNRPASGTADGTNRNFTLEAPPTTGEGRGVITADPSKLGPDSARTTAYYGFSPTDTTAVHIEDIAPGNVIKLAVAPPADATVFVTEFINRLPDDSWTVTNVAAGGAGDGTYSIAGTNSGIAMGVVWSMSDSSVGDPDFSTENVTYPTGTGPGNSDGEVNPGYAVAETVRLTFQGSAPSKKYIVTSSVANGTGSSGDNTGYLGQTYEDKKTGFRITVLPGATVTYNGGDHLGYKVSPHVTVGSETKGTFIPGLRTTVSTTAGIGVGDTALVNTYNRSGAEPNVGDFYYVSFDEMKQFDANGLQTAALYTSETAVVSATGPITINNRVGLAAHLAFLNGAAAVAILQLEKTNGVDAPDSSYIAGIDYFNEPMPGGVRPSLMEPVTTSSAVINYLKSSNVIQSGIRYANEHMSYFGFPLNTPPTTAQTFARAMNSERMIGIYPDGAVTTITDSQGNDVQYLVDGAMMAAAVAGRDVSPAFDVAEPLTRKQVVGFVRLNRRMDSVTAAQTANAGLTLLEEQSASIIVKFGLTTDVSSVLTRTPSVVRIKDFVQKGARSVLQPYIGQKFLPQRTRDIETTLSSYLSSLKQASIITAFSGVKAVPDASDPTIVRVVAYYSPVLPLLWIVISFNLRASV